MKDKGGRGKDKIEGPSSGGVHSCHGRRVHSPGTAQNMAFLLSWENVTNFLFSLHTEMAYSSYKKDEENSNEQRCFVGLGKKESEQNYYIF